MNMRVSLMRSQPVAESVLRGEASKFEASKFQASMVEAGLFQIAI